MFFEPSFIGKEDMEIHDISFQIIMMCDVDFCKDWLANVISSGTTMLRGTDGRMMRRAAPSFDIKAVALYDCVIASRSLRGKITKMELWKTSNQDHTRQRSRNGGNRKYIKHYQVSAEESCQE